ncbi:MAG: hypothetical protein Q9167_007802 [Letrouitia subvulpina]
MEPSKLNTLDGEVTFDEAVQEEHNMLQRLTYWQRELDFLSYLHQQRDKIEALVSTHLGMQGSEDCQLTQPVDWIHGSFNVCLPVNISGWSKYQGRRVLVRFPLPYKIGELENPGNADEKLRCEAAAYIWIQENCPDVSIPRLWGFAFSGGCSLVNKRIPTNIDRHLTYATVEPYLLDLLALHDSRLRNQPNSINDASDCRDQMAALTCMRSVLHHFYRRDLRDGPFIFTFTDINQYNVFVDANQLDGEHLVAFNEVREEFMDAFEKEEKLLSPSRLYASSRTHIMKSGWDSGNFFYFHALNTTVGLCTLFWLHIQPRFARSHALDTAFAQIVAPYWCIEADDFIATKLEEREDYQNQLQSEDEATESRGRPSNQQEGVNAYISPDASGAAVTDERMGPPSTSQSDVKTPRPDISIGLKDAALNKSLQPRGLAEADTQYLLRTLAKPHSQTGRPPLLYSEPTQASLQIRFLFLSVEGKSYATCRTIYEAQNQAAVSGACSLKILHDLDDLVRKSDPGNYSKVQPIMFSVCTEGPIHQLWVHYTIGEHGDGNRMYYMAQVKTCDVGVWDDNILLFLEAVDNVLKWGSGEYKEAIAEQLSTIWRHRS